MSIRVKKSNLIQFPIFYSCKKNKYDVEVINILAEDEAKKMLEDPNKKAEVNVLNTVWKQLNYKESSTLRDKVNHFDPATNQIVLDWQGYRELQLKTCLVDWDDQENGVKTPINIDELHPSIAEAMLNKYDLVTNISGEEEKK